MAAPHVKQRALHIYMLGIGVQELAIVAFVALCMIFQVLLLKLEGSWKESNAAVPSSRRAGDRCCWFCIFHSP